jgi:hypothetical protein
MNRNQRIPWHKLLGQALEDALTGLPYQVSTEEELALRSQRLDVLIIEQGESPSVTSRPAEDRPDGLEQLNGVRSNSFAAFADSLFFSI